MIDRTLIMPGRRVVRLHDQLMDGLADLLTRAPGSSVIDLGMNRGLVGYTMAWYGARLVHGIELAPDGVQAARAMFADLVEVQSQFEVGDLTRGPECLAPFGGAGWDIVLMLGVYHKIKRVPSKPYKELGARGMNAEELSELMTALGRRALKYFAFRGDIGDFEQVDKDLGKAGLRRIHTSEISVLGPSGIWRRD